jgi:hypothetical protein
LTITLLTIFSKERFFFTFLNSNELLLPDSKSDLDESSRFCKLKAVGYKVQENLQKPSPVP